MKDNQMNNAKLLAQGVVHTLAIIIIAINYSISYNGVMVIRVL